MTDVTTESQGSPPEKLTMGIDPYEKNWMRLTVVLLLGFFATVSVAGFSLGFQLNGVDEEVDPTTLLEGDTPWANPGLREVGEGRYEAYIVAQTWTFSPASIEVPVGSTVDIYVTSIDLQHGLKVTDTNINMQVVPGQVSKMTYTFDQVGEFPYICTEYCGQAHVAMWGTINVVPATSGDDPEEASS